MTNREEAAAFLPVPPQDLQLLLALRSGPLHGYAMMKAVETQSGGRVRVELGSLYRILHRFERDGLIEEAQAPAGDVAPGRERRHYQATPLGNAVMLAELERLREVLELAAGLRPSEARP